MIGWDRQGTEKIKCELTEMNQSAQSQTAFTQKVIFTEEFPGMIIKLFQENVLDQCGDWRTRERKVILKENDPLYHESTCVR